MRLATFGENTEKTGPEGYSAIILQAQNHGVAAYAGLQPELLLEGKESNSINRRWISDITYIPMGGGSFCYLAMLMVRFSRRIVGSSRANSMT